MRVFFLTNHKILVRTELPRLRALGLEVFHPRYRPKNAQHQSASEDWDDAQPSTLPAATFATLAAQDFFYTAITDEAAALLNEHFDAVIVTSDPGWLAEIVRVYRGRVLFRAYGQVVNLSEWLFERGALRAIVARDDFWFVPHASEAVAPEHAWLKERMAIVPYVPANEALSLQGAWTLDAPHDDEIMVACPNLANPFYAAHFRYLKRRFNDPVYRYYGVQTTRVHDPHVVGTLPPEEYFASFPRVAGFLDAHRIATVCFLPPIEMMLAGGPVIFLTGSLLDASMPRDAPGRAHDEAEAHAKCMSLLPGHASYDRDFVSRVIASQAELRSRYLPEQVWPVFDEVVPALLRRTSPGRRLIENIEAADANATDGGRQLIWFLAHRDDDPIGSPREGYPCGDRQLLELRAAVRSVLTSSACDVVLTCRKRHLAPWDGFFRLPGDADRIRFHVVDGDVPASPPPHVEPTKAQATFAARVVGGVTRLAQRAQRLARLTKRRVGSTGSTDSTGSTGSTVIDEALLKQRIAQDAAAIGVVSEPADVDRILRRVR